MRQHVLSNIDTECLMMVSCFLELSLLLLETHLKEDHWIKHRIFILAHSGFHITDPFYNKDLPCIPYIHVNMTETQAILKPMTFPRHTLCSPALFLLVSVGFYLKFFYYSPFFLLKWTFRELFAPLESPWMSIYVHSLPRYQTKAVCERNPA